MRSHLLLAATSIVAAVSAMPAEAQRRATPALSAREVQTARQQHPQLIQEFGGADTGHEVGVALGVAGALVAREVGGAAGDQGVQRLHARRDGLGSRGLCQRGGAAGGEGFLDVKNAKGNSHKLIITL